MESVHKCVFSLPLHESTWERGWLAVGSCMECEHAMVLFEFGSMRVRWVMLVFCMMRGSHEFALIFYLS